MAGRRFYTEVVIVTILTWIAANTWSDLFGKLVEEEFGNSNFVYLMVAVVVTVGSILILNYFFTEGEKNPKHILTAANFVKRNGKYAEQEGYTNDITDSTSCPCGGICRCDSCGK